ncbi:alpha/beta hydrolase [Spirulina subsalsa FACHB-351]|uniref:Alpha/beta hydrolase n=1 Tax=Spirulina subsalsa FACHB-351 TaxID=234711 RepID=A0ABT3KZW8_9CYAN|nr:alpha/beta hydrolase [Spirulina subsalsa FACHB-351]
MVKLVEHSRSKTPDVVWLNGSPALQKLDRPLLKYLVRYCTVAHWEYCPNLDQPLGLEDVVILLHHYLKTLPYPVHLVGHGISGLLGLLYGECYPEKVRSLTLLSVGVDGGMDWQAYYYRRMSQFPCLRQPLLLQMVNHLFGYQSGFMSHQLVRLLEEDLQTSISPHTLAKQFQFHPRMVDVPLLVCGSEDDEVVDNERFQEWRCWLKKCDRLWQYPQGRYFFHYFYPQEVGQQILNFWRAKVYRDQLAQESALP